jgi:hypothetical protein
VLSFVTESRRAGGAIDRREWLRLSGLAGLGLLGLTATSAPAAGVRRARSVLLVFTSGGMSQLDTVDPKPDAPAEVRGAFGTIATAVPGVRFCEHLPRLARLADRFTLVRSVSHDDLDHGSACYLALTGHFHAKKSGNPLPSPNDLPTYGALVHRLRPDRRFPYTAVHVNGPAQVPELPAPGQFAGILGRSCEPLVLGDPTQETALLAGLDGAPEVPAVRTGERRSLLESLDGYARKLEGERPVLDMNVLYRQAYEMLSSPQHRRAFDLAQEPAAVRDRYGRHRSGQACLLGRRLVEAGVPFVTVFWNHNNRGQDRTPDQPDSYGWDTHNDIFETLKGPLLPRFDRTFSVLLEDLEQRGLLDSTLVVCMGEFGRAPLVAPEPRFAGTTSGRKHWAAVYSVLLAGAGIGRGAVYGSSDRHGAYPSTSPVGPCDLAATMYAALGIDPGGHFTDPAGRILPLVHGKPIAGLYQ